MSERDGWNHLYLYDGATGQVKNQITKGEWVVRGVDQVDEAKRQIWFQAGGIRPGQDPYFIHYCRINFDGTGLIALTEGDGTHTVDILAGPPVLRRHLVARRSAARRRSCAATEDRQARPASSRAATCAALLATGWKPPEPFVAKGRDGKTDIYGVIFRPTNFDPTKKYPVIENIYAGPQGSFVPKTFSRLLRASGRWPSSGFIVVQIDGMGTSNRSKAFHDVCWKNLGDAGFPDRILWLKAVGGEVSLLRHHAASASTAARPAARTPLGGVLFHPEFYKVARRPTAAATTTGWTRSGGTSSGWAGRSARTTRRRRTWTTPTSSRANCC